MATKTYTVRPASRRDFPAVIRIIQAAKLPTEGVPERLDNYFVAETDDQVVGVAGLELHGDSALLRSVAVAQEERHAGVGGALVETALQRSKELGVHDLFLLTSTAEGFFPRFGFGVTTRDQVPDAVLTSGGFKAICPENAVVMKRTEPK